MNDYWPFQRFAAVLAIISFPLALGSLVLPLMPADYDFDAFSNPVHMLSAGAGGASLLRWGMILDMLGFYLPLLPIALFLWQWLKPKSPNWARFYTLCGLGYVFIGAIGAAILAAVYPPLINAYTQASAQQRAVLETVFDTITNMVVWGMWNILEVLLAGAWFLGIGLLLHSERRIFSIVSIVLGISALLDSAGMMLSIQALADLGLYVYLVLAPIWALWLGIDLLRKPVQIETP